MVHSGRGGAGNIRSPSREPRDRANEQAEDALQARLIAEERGRAQAVLSTGRGGVGNIAGGRSKSRSRSAVRDGRDESVARKAGDRHGSGRGGWGNINEERDRDSMEEEKVSWLSLVRQKLIRRSLKRRRSTKQRSGTSTLQGRPTSREVPHVPRSPAHPVQTCQWTRRRRQHYHPSPTHRYSSRSVRGTSGTCQATCDRQDQGSKHGTRVSWGPLSSVSWGFIVRG